MFWTNNFSSSGGFFLYTQQIVFYHAYMGSSQTPQVHGKILYVACTEEPIILTHYKLAHLSYGLWI